MEIEEKIIHEIRNYFVDDSELDMSLFSEINRIIVNESVKVENKEKTDKDALNFVENKLHDLFL